MKTKQQTLENRFNAIQDGFDYLVTIAEYNQSVKEAKTQRELEAIIKRFNKQLDKQGVSE